MNSYYVIFFVLNSWNTEGYILHVKAGQRTSKENAIISQMPILSFLISSLYKWPAIYLPHLYNQFLKPLIHFYLINWFR